MGNYPFLTGCFAIVTALGSLARITPISIYFLVLRAAIPGPRLPKIVIYES
ncbi:hypothetical protein GQ41_2875 [Arenibacter algicola]|uniref:Uncharacterized protein n=1 Tax=Arenibacter algicola TaxID=616991 RepID=A0ABY3ABU1_9FLAO|tara:strand:+ start:13253 stop:13405 length:153 start_codon:yes stop_codon:yes gene_type:complete